MSTEMAGFTTSAQYIMPIRWFIYTSYNIMLMALEKYEISEVIY